MRPRPCEIRVGTSGWHYEHWRGTFYPEGLPKSRWFEYYAQHFDTVEVNNTFYRLPRESTVEKWRWQAANGFTYVVKANRYITHIKGHPSGLHTSSEVVYQVHICLLLILNQLTPASPGTTPPRRGFIRSVFRGKAPGRLPVSRHVTRLIEGGYPPARSSSSDPSDSAGSDSGEGQNISEAMRSSE